jgi:hypothetical protein
LASLTDSWRKSSRSNTNGACVEVRHVEDVIEVRDTKDRGGPVLQFSSQSWRSFVDAVHSGDFDRS